MSSVPGTIPADDSTVQDAPNPASNSQKSHGRTITLTRFPTLSSLREGMITSTMNTTHGPTKYSEMIEELQLPLEQKHTIFTFTPNPALDKSTAVPAVFHTEKLRCSEPLKAEPGGGGINVSRAIRKLGGESQALYLAGGINGQIYANLLDHELPGEHIKVEIEGETRESFTCYDSATGKEYRFNMPGPVLTSEEYTESLSVLNELLEPPPGFIVLSGSLPSGVPPTYFGEIAKIAHAKGVKVILDTSGPPLLAAAQMSDNDIFMAKPNKEEIESMLAMKDKELSYLKDELDAITQIEDDEQLVAAARMVIQRKRVSVVVVSLGKAGAMLVTEDHVEFMRGMTVPVKSAVGAGDTMVGAITLALAREWPMPMAVKFGLAAGAACVMTPGSELCRREDTERLFLKMLAQNKAIKYS